MFWTALEPRWVVRARRRRLSGGSLGASDLGEQRHHTRWRGASLEFAPRYPEAVRMLDSASSAKMPNMSIEVAQFRMAVAIHVSSCADAIDIRVRAN